MNDSKVIRVSGASYRRLSELASNRGISVAEALGFIIKDPERADDGPRVKAELFDKFWLDLGQLTGASWEEFVDAIRDGSLVKSFQEFLEKAEALEEYQKMFICPKCGKPMPWDPKSKLGQALQLHVAKDGWAHSPSCLQQRS